MAEAQKVAIVVALEREVPLLVKTWRRVERDYDGRRYRFFEGPSAVLVCGGIGAEFARRAAEAVIALYQPALVVSAGFAGGLTADRKVGDVIFPSIVVDSQDGSRVQTASSESVRHCIAQGVLVSVAFMAEHAQKQRLAAAYGAQAVDMEAAAVARAAEAHGLAFVAVKAISDTVDQALPAMNGFVRADGRFATARFVLQVAPRFWLWPRVARLARNSRIASRCLCECLSDAQLMWGRAPSPVQAE